MSKRKPDKAKMVAEKLINGNKLNLDSEISHFLESINMPVEKNSSTWVWAEREVIQKMAMLTDNW